MAGYFNLRLASAAVFLLSGHATAQPETPVANAVASVDADPCAAGVFGPAALETDIRPVELPHELRYDGAVPTWDVDDPCGLRFADLSGVWMFNGYQAVAYHDLRTGRFRMRFTHVAPDRDYRRIWDYRFGDAIIDGVIVPDVNQIVVSLLSRYPPGVQQSCPDDYESADPYYRLVLDYDQQGRVRIQGTRQYSRIDSSCFIYIDDFLTDQIIRTGVEAQP